MELEKIVSTRRLLEARKRELHEQRGEIGVRAAIESDDPLAALQALVTISLEGSVLAHAIQKLRALEKDAKREASYQERKAAAAGKPRMTVNSGLRR